MKRHKSSIIRTLGAILLLVSALAYSAWQYKEQGRVTWHLGVLEAAQDYSGQARALWREFAINQTPAASGDELKGRVAKVGDGDTLTLLVNGRGELTIRLYGIDAPEWNQPHGSTASRALERLVDGRRVSVAVVDTDDYGRLVGTVYLDQQDVNLTMVREGHAWWYRYYADSNRALADAEARARDTGTGLWSRSNPVPPWDWRRRN